MIYKENLLPIALLEHVPDGYFAWQPDSTVPLKFVRISRPTTGRFKDCIKIQTQHGSRLTLAAYVTPSKHLVLTQPGITDTLLGLICDYRNAARRYSKELRHCCRCNTDLTDQRSRHYGIGPECENYFGWIIEAVDEENDGLTFEELNR